ncbi:hypothetical protein OUZ56_000272 [Daphnia magna]|uniref:Secreted protein n=1 Tax=Daphnia magna TaxID=35525 RepID=A0ABR0A001_9CRUS|nr:hypothetical protein OUZ56_000272 [Daphnia magna]
MIAIVFQLTKVVSLLVNSVLENAESAIIVGNIVKKEKETVQLQGTNKKDRHPHQHCPEVCNYLMVNRGNAINAAF